MLHTAGKEITQCATENKLVSAISEGNASAECYMIRFVTPINVECEYKQVRYVD